MVKGMEVDTQEQPHQCQACIEGKAHVLPFPKESQHVYENIGDMIYTDLWGKSCIKGIRGKSYFISFMDAKTV
jgi:hypothetical protein